MRLLSRFLFALACVVVASAAQADCTLSASPYDLASQATTLSCLSGSGTITNGGTSNKVLTIGPGTTDTALVFSGTIANGSGTVALIKSGSDTLTLSGTGSHTGDTGLLDPAFVSSTGAGPFSTAVTGGTLIVGSTTALGSSGLIVSSATVKSGLGVGTTLELANNIMIGTSVGATATFDTSGGDIRQTGKIWGFDSDFLNEFSTDRVQLIKTGSGTLFLDGFNYYRGGTVVEAGTLEINSDRSLGRGGTINLEMWGGTTLITSDTIRLHADSGTIYLNCNGSCTSAVAISPVADTTLTIYAAVTGDADLKKAGAGTLILTNDNTTYTGSTEIAAGILEIQSATALGSGVSSGSTSLAIDDGATLRTNLGASGGVDLVLAPSSLKIAGAATLDTVDSTVDVRTAITDGATAGRLIKTGTGTLIVSAASTYTGGTLISAGTLQLGVADALPTAGAVEVASGATLDLAGRNQTVTSLTGAGTVTDGGVAATLTLAQANGTTDTFSGSLTGTLALTKSGTGTLVLSGSNTYSGTTWIQGGTLLITSAGALSSSTSLQLDDGTTLAFSGVSGTFGTAVALTGVADPIIDTGAGTITLTGAISGSGVLTKIGTGKLILTAASTYTGNTNVSAGTLEVDGSIATSPLTTVSSGSASTSAILSGTGTVGALTVGYGTVAPGNANDPTGTLTATGAVGFSSNSTLAVSVSSTGASKLVTSGSASVAGTVSATLLSGATLPTAGTRYAIVTASGGVTGTFGGLLTYGFGGIAAFLTYDADNVYLQFGPDRSVIGGSVTQLARDRQGQMISGRILGSVLLGANEQISCASACLSAFGAVGSFQAGVHGRASLTDEISVIGGLAWATWDSGGAKTESAPMLAAALRWDPDGFGSSRPYAEVGMTTTPWARSRYSRSYDFSGTSYTGRGSVDTSSVAVFGKVGWVARLAPTDEVAASVEAWTGWMRTGAYSEQSGVGNPIAASYAAAVDRMNIAKVGGQWTHLWGRQIETQINLGVAGSFASRSGVRATFTGYGDIAGTPREAVWAEYGLRVGWRMNKSWVADVFADGTLGDKPVGNTIHGGLGLRHAF